jgi:hypothetical protein
MRLRLATESLDLDLVPVSSANHSYVIYEHGTINSASEEHDHFRCLSDLIKSLHSFQKNKIPASDLLYLDSFCLDLSGARCP